MPLVGVLLMVLAAGLAVTAIVRAPRRSSVVLAVAALLPLAVLIVAVWVWLES